MAITQRVNELPAEALAQRRDQRAVEQAEARFDVAAPWWGAEHPVSGEWERPDRAGRGAVVGFWERSPENWGIVHRDPAPSMADWTAVTPRFADRKPNSGLDPYTLAAVRTVGVTAVRAARLAKIAAPRLPALRLPSGRKATPGRYTAANEAAASYKAPTP